LKWCWTQIDPKKKIDPDNGSNNWGYCVDPSKSKKKYKIIVNSANMNTPDARDRFMISLKG